MRKLVYVVDDQQAVMETAALVIQSIDPEWEVAGFLDAVEAMAAVKSRAPDLVLSDQVMPRMQGSQLLEEVRVVCPNAVRMIMSGHVALAKLSMITSAHQYISKPFDALELKALVVRTFAAQDRMRASGLETIVTSLRGLPSVPQVYQALLVELEDCHGTSTAIAQMVAEDVGLSTKVLQLANSPLFGPGYLVSNPREAVLCLGTEMIKAIVLAQTLFKHFGGLRHSDLDLQRVWGHCWDVALLGQYCCRQKRLPADQVEQAFLAGLLHETGRLVLAESFPDRFQAACQQAREAKTPLLPCLVDTFKATPTQLTAYLLELWGLPGDVVAAIALQDAPQQDRTGSFSMATALYVADHIADTRSSPDGFPVEDWNAEYLKTRGCADEIREWEQVVLTPPVGAGGA